MSHCQPTPSTCLKSLPRTRARHKASSRCRCQGSPLPYAVAVPEDAEWFTHMHEMGLPQSLSLQVAGTLVGAFAASRLLSLLAERARHKVGVALSFTRTFGAGY